MRLGYFTLPTARACSQADDLLGWLVWVCRAGCQTRSGRPSLMHPDFCGSSISDLLASAQNGAPSLASTIREPTCIPAGRRPTAPYTRLSRLLGLRTCVPPSRLLKDGFRVWHVDPSCQPLEAVNTVDNARPTACQARDGTFPCSVATTESTLRPFLAGF